MCAGDDYDADRDDEVRMRARAEYCGFEFLLKGVPQMIPPLAEASAPHCEDVASATAHLHRVRYARWPAHTLRVCVAPAHTYGRRGVGT